jgi:peptide methionine sulfoxide reductase MsrA
LLLKNAFGRRTAGKIKIVSTLKYDAFLWPVKIVTEVVPVTDFRNAEAEHQDYLQKHPYGYTCHFERPDWKLGE